MLRGFRVSRCQHSLVAKVDALGRVMLRGFRVSRCQHMTGALLSLFFHCFSTFVRTSLRANASAQRCSEYTFAISSKRRQATSIRACRIFDAA
jgi:hypothetical protein